MRSLSIALIAGLIGCALAGAMAELDQNVQECLGQYKAAVAKAELPEDVLEFIKSGSVSGPAPVGCIDMYGLSEKFIDEVPCAAELIYMDEDILDNLKQDPKVDQFYQGATACALAQYGGFDSTDEE